VIVDGVDFEGQRLRVEMSRMGGDRGGGGGGGGGPRGYRDRDGGYGRDDRYDRLVRATTKVFCTGSALCPNILFLTYMSIHMIFSNMQNFYACNKCCSAADSLYKCVSWKHFLRTEANHAR
jgi:hypothetical protein